MGNAQLVSRSDRGVRTFIRWSSRGVTLIEVLVALCFASIAAIGCLSLAALAIRTYELSSLRWKQTVKTWNQSQELRSAGWEGSDPGQVLIPAPLPLRRFEIRTEGEPEPQQWEVLHEKK